FWNIREKPLLARVTRLVTRHAVDVVVLAECVAAPADVLGTLNAIGGSVWVRSNSLNDRVLVFNREAAGAPIGRFNGFNNGLTICELRPPARPSLVLAALHFPSKHGWSEEDQLSFAPLMAATVERIEDQIAVHRTVMVGDFNMNPFDPSMVSGFGFHALMT